MNNIYIKAEEIPTELIEKYFNNKELITIDQLICALDDANFDLKKLEEEFEDYKKYVESNYREMSYAEQIGYPEFR